MLNLPSDMTPQQDIFNNAVDLFSSDAEDVRAAAAFAAGNDRFPNLHLSTQIVYRKYCHWELATLFADYCQSHRERSYKEIAVTACPQGSSHPLLNYPTGERR